MQNGAQYNSFPYDFIKMNVLFCGTLTNFIQIEILVKQVGLKMEQTLA